MKTAFKMSIVIAIFISACTTSPKQTQIELSGTTMGTNYSIKIAGVEYDSIEIKNLQNKVDSLLEHVNMQMSTYIPESEISRFNFSSDTVWQSVSRDFGFVLNQSKKIGELSSGALDITIEPIVNLWGFGPEDRPQQIPTDQLIAERLKFIGLNKIKVELKNDSAKIKKLIPELKLDLSATAKGFGVDKISEFLTHLGLNNFMVEIGGEVRTKGKNNDGNIWQIGISTPDKTGRIQKVLSLNNLAMATSGDYWNYFEEGGKRFSHTIDPRTGKPIVHNLASVTVIDSTCMNADGFATAIDVMGAAEGIKFADKLNLAVYLIVRENEYFKVILSKEFKKLFKE